MVRFYLTEVGKAAVVNAENLSLDVELTNIVVGNAKYNAATEAAGLKSLKSQLAKYSLSGGGTQNQTLNLVAAIDSTITADIYEVGILTREGVLFAVAAVDGDPLFSLVNDITTVVTLGISLSDVDASRIVINIDTNTSAAAQLMNEHLAADNPHPQYFLNENVESILRRISQLENRVIEDTKVGDLFITTLSFANSDEVHAHKGYGRWEKFGNGHALVTQGIDNSRPAWMREINSVGGEDSHELSIEEMPKHSLSYHKANYNYGHKDGGQDWSRYGHELGENNAQTSEIGEGKAHNNIQLSIIIAAWRRLPELDVSYVLENVPEIFEGDLVTFKLKTNLVQYSTVGFKLLLDNGFNKESISGSFIIDENGVGTYIYRSTKTADIKDKTLLLQLNDVSNITSTVNIKNITKVSTYYEGSYDIEVKPNQLVTFDLFGAGGGGGGAIYNYSSPNYSVSSDGFNGGDVVLSIADTLIMKAGGGKAGTGAHWGNGSSFSNGVPGKGGENTIATDQRFVMTENQKGNDAATYSRWVRQDGAAALNSDIGALNGGGAGALGVGDEQWSFGGGGGSGGRVKCEFMNTTDDVIVLKLDVGGKGLGWKLVSGTNGNQGDDGGIGFAIVSVT